MDPFNISCCVGTSDEKLFKSVVNQGVDAHLEAFTASKFYYKEGDFVARLHLDFDRAELPILIRRLRELGTEESERWADDIEEASKNE